MAQNNFQGAAGDHLTSEGSCKGFTQAPKTLCGEFAKQGVSSQARTKRLDILARHGLVEMEPGLAELGAAIAEGLFNPSFLQGYETKVIDIDVYESVIRI